MSEFKKRVANRKCGRCGKVDIDPAGRKHCDSCAATQRENAKKLRKKRKEDEVCILCGKKSVKNVVHCNSCRRRIDDWKTEKGREYNRAASRKSNLRLREETLNAYGGACKCCGETEGVFLTIDHIDNNGANHRRELKGRNYGCGSTNVYRWLRKNGFPDGFQILCWNCNWAKSHGGCPHQKK